MPKTRDDREKAAVTARRKIQAVRVALDNDRVGTPTERADRAVQWAEEAMEQMEDFLAYVRMEAKKLRERNEL